jgi:hypothetical protein
VLIVLLVIVLGTIFQVLRRKAFAWGEYYCISMVDGRFGIREPRRCQRGFDRLSNFVSEQRNEDQDFAFGTNAAQTSLSFAKMNKTAIRIATKVQVVSVDLESSPMPQETTQ